MNSVPASNRLWSQFVHQLQIVFATLLLTLQLIWLIFRGNLGTLRMLALSAPTASASATTRCACESDGAPEVRAAADAFNNMANNIESLIASLGEIRNQQPPSRGDREAVERSDLDARPRRAASRPGTRAPTVLFGYTAGEAIGHLHQHRHDADRRKRKSSASSA